jgi:F0F1-type ATP synthase assembly protein I
MLPENQRPQKKWGPYLKYSGLAFQLAAVVLAGILIGGWLDKQFMLQKPLFTMLLVMIFFGGFMYKLYKELTSTK